MLNFILIVVLSIVTGSLLSLWQGYIKVTKQLKRRDLLNQEIEEIVQKVKALNPKKDTTILRNELGKYNRDTLENTKISLDLNYVILKERFTKGYDQNYLKNTVKAPKTNGISEHA